VVATERLVAALALLVGTALPAGAAREAPPAPVEIVGVAANTGQAAGGHVALRLGDHVYHFEVRDDRLLHLARESWTLFRTRYGDLENRSLRAVRLATAPEGAERLEEGLAELLVAQRWQLDRLEALGLQTRWLASLGRQGGSVSLRGLGLFSADGRDDADGLSLRRAIEARHGGDFLGAERVAVEEALRAGALEVEPEAPPGSAPAPLEGGEIAAERLRDRLLLREALRVLAEARPLAPQAVFDPDVPAAGDPGRPLDPVERAQLEGLASRLEASVVRLVRSRRPDRGFPLLLASARYQAVRRSLATGRLAVLDAFADAPPALDAAEARRQRSLLEALAGDARESWIRVRGSVLAQGTLDEYAEHELEEAGSVYAELRAAASGERLLRRWTGEPLLPGRRGAALLPALDVEEPARERALAAARAGEARQRAALEASYGYRLLQRNCATELVRAMRSAFDDEEAATRALGGALRPGEALSFVPALLRREAGRRFRAAGERVIPSYRQRRVAELEARGPALLVALRESNTLTSRAYRPSFRDEPFLWFSDGPVPLRPLQGAANLGYGLLRATLGLATLPFDGGRESLAGLRGAFYSLPELAGWNLRKGRYDRLPPPDARLADQSPDGSWVR
jgi:hypothetical protein